MRFSRAGVIFCGVYLAIAAILITAGSLVADGKTAVVLYQLSVYPGLMLLVIWEEVVGFAVSGPLGESPLGGFPLLLLLSCALAYCAGWAAGRLRAC